MSDAWFEMSNDLLCEASLNGYFTRLNDAWETCLGYTRAELMSRPYAELIHPDDLPGTIATAGRLAAGPSAVVNFENRFRARTGEWHWLSWSSRSDSDKIYAVARDVTKSKELEAERETLLARVEAMARTDELTGLPNRRAWDEELRRELDRTRRHNSSLAVAMIDLDHFKRYNDTHGHPAGDELLRNAGAAWRLTLRVTDLIARYGGEEFGILLPDCPPRNGVAVLDRLRAVTPSRQTVSAGMAIWNGRETAEALVSRADAALYQAKRQGRDACVLAS